MSNRHRERLLATQALYSWDVGETEQSLLTGFPWHERRTEDTLDFARLIVAGTLERVSEIDDLVARHLNGWTLDRIAAVDRAILRISTYGLIAQPDIPVEITIDEALQLAHELSSDESYRFVNGVLDAIRREIGRDEAHD